MIWARLFKNTALKCGLQFCDLALNEEDQWLAFFKEALFDWAGHEIYGLQAQEAKSGKLHHLQQSQRAAEQSFNFSCI